MSGLGQGWGQAAFGPRRHGAAPTVATVQIRALPLPVGASPRALSHPLRCCVPTASQLGYHIRVSPSSALEHSSPKWDCSQSPPVTRWNALALPFLQASCALPPPPVSVSCPWASSLRQGAQRPLLAVKGPSRPSSPRPPLQVLGQTVSRKSGPRESSASSVGRGADLPGCLTPGL